MAAPTLAMYSTCFWWTNAFFYTPIKLVGEVAGKVRHLGCPKIVLDPIMYMYIIYYINYVCAHHNAYVQKHLFATAANHKAWCMASDEALLYRNKAYLT